MTSYPNLGKVGRLGNHLFQIAATMGLALDHGEEYAFPKWQYEKDFHLSGCFHKDLPPGPEYSERRFCYDPIPYSPGLRLHGFFQSEKYFRAHSDVVRQALTPLPCGVPFKGVASVHVRRGDYLKLPEKHPVLPMSWHQVAMGLLRARGVMDFLVFSDDLEWCRAQKWGPGVRVIGDMGPIEQLALTIACEHHVLANSTFSWWGAWLDPRPGKVVIAPADWFGPKFRGEFDTADLFPKGWIVV